MSRFSDEERAQIQSQLVEEGRTLFAQFGFERTRIRDVTDAVGIGTSTFYQFYDSKEALYADVLYAERDHLNDQLAAAISDADSQRQEVRTLLQAMFHEVRSNSLISRLIMEDELHVLQEKLSDAERESIATDVYDESADHIVRWTENPEFKYDDPDVVQSIFHSLVFTTRSRDIALDAGVEYEEIERQLIETIVDGLFTGH